MAKKKKLKVNKKKFTCSMLVILIILSIPIFLIKNWVDTNSKESSSTYLTHKHKPIEESKQEKSSKEDKPSCTEKPIEEKPKIDDNKIIDIPITNYKAFLKNSVILGDSISEGLSFYEVLDENNVVAKKGLTVYKAENEINNIVSKNPEKLFIFLGNNDLFEEKLTEEQFLKQYSILIDKLKEKLPNTKIYLLSILPITDKAVKENHFLNKDRILSFDVAIKSMAEKHNLEYINIIPVIRGREHLYEQDGIHLKYDFYKYLLSYVENYIKKNTI